MAAPIDNREIAMLYELIEGDGPELQESVQRKIDAGYITLGGPIHTRTAAVMIEGELRDIAYFAQALSCPEDTHIREIRDGVSRRRAEMKRGQA
jgi:hypothetical protein